MKKLLHIIATPREDESRTLQVSRAFIGRFAAAHRDWKVDSLNLAQEKLPEISAVRAGGKYALLAGGELSGAQEKEWKEIVAHIERFLAADAYLISTPMWNFTAPYLLKHYIDVIVQPKYLFRYTPQGVEGLVKNKKMIVISSRGGDYEPQEMRGFDFLEPYLRTIFGFTGVTDITFVNAQPMDMDPAVRKAKLDRAVEDAEKLAGIF